MILTAAELQEYNELHTPKPLDALFIESAQGIVEDYLGYAIEAADYSELTYSGDGSGVLFLGMKPINSIAAVIIDDGDPIEDLSSIIIGPDGWIHYETGFNQGLHNVKISFNAGYTSDAIPAVMKLTALRIAGILQKEAGGNIGINSITDPATGSRSFQEIKFGKYLSLLDKYRVKYRDR